MTQPVVSGEEVSGSVPYAFVPDILPQTRGFFLYSRAKEFVLMAHEVAPIVLVSRAKPALLSSLLKPTLLSSAPSKTLLRSVARVILEGRKP